MKFVRLLAISLLLVPVALQSQTKKKHPTLPAVFNSARYVWVEAMDGDAFTPGLLPEDRRAISDVRDALSDWGRYVLTANRGEAELIFVVRKGRLAEGKIGGTVGTPPGSGPVPGQRAPVGTGVMLGGEAGPPDDLLEVRQNNNGQDSSPIWRRSETDGLASPNVPLFEQLKSAVEHDYPKTAASQPAKP